MDMTGETMEDYYARQNLEGNRKVWVENRRKINYVYRKTRKYLRRQAAVCEIGVGEGYLLRILHSTGLRVLGIDISNYLINELRDQFRKEGLDIELVQGDLSSIDLKNGIDVFFCLDVLEHVPDIEKAIRNLNRGLRSGGLLIGTLPLHENMDENMVVCPECRHTFHRIGHHHSFDSIEEVVQLLCPQFDITEMGEVNPFGKMSDAIGYVIRSILKFALRKKIPSTVYFVAKCKR